MKDRADSWWLDPSVQLASPVRNGLFSMSELHEKLSTSWLLEWYNA